MTDKIYRPKGANETRYSTAKLAVIVEAGLRPTPTEQGEGVLDIPELDWHRMSSSSKVIPITRARKSKLTYEGVGDQLSRYAPAVTAAIRREGKTTQTKILGGKVPVGDSYSPQQIDAAVMKYCQERGIDVEPVHERYQKDGAMGRFYTGLDVNQDEPGDRVLFSEVFVKAVTAGNPEDFADEGRKQKDIAAKAGSTPAVYHHDEITMDNGATLPIIVMELLEGQNMERYVNSREDLKNWYKQDSMAERKSSLKEILTLYKQMVDAVGEAHNAGYVNRDITLKNFMRTDDGQVKLIDYAAATKADEKPADREIFHGTPHYCSPEHLLNKVDTRMDIFSLGCALHAMVTGQPPYTHVASLYFDKKSGEVSQTKANKKAGLMLYAAMQNKDRVKNPEAESKVQELSDGLSFILDACLNPNPEERFQNCDALSNAVSQVIGRLEGDKILSHTVEVCTIDPSLYASDEGERKRRVFSGREKELAGIADDWEEMLDLLETDI